MEVLQLEDSLTVGRADRSCTSRLPLPCFSLADWSPAYITPRRGQTPTVPQDLHYCSLKPVSEAEMANSMETHFCTNNLQKRLKQSPIVGCFNHHVEAICSGSWCSVGEHHRECKVKQQRFQQRQCWSFFFFNESRGQIEAGVWGRGADETYMQRSV